MGRRGRQSSAIQRKLSEQFKLSLTYMDVASWWTTSELK